MTIKFVFGPPALVFWDQDQSGSFEFENAGAEGCYYCLLLTSISSFSLDYLAVSFIAGPPPLPSPPRVFKYLFLSENEFLFVFSGSLKHTSELLPKKAIWSNIRPDQTEHI